MSRNRDLADSGSIINFIDGITSNVNATFVTKSTALSSNNELKVLIDDRLQVANADASFVTKSIALSSNNALNALIDDRLQVANADSTFVTKSTALSSNNELKLLIDDRLQVANADSTYVTKSTALSSNNELKVLIDDRLQVANADILYTTKSSALSSNNALKLLIDDRMQVANVNSLVSSQLSALVDSAPETLNTLNEIAAALNDDANFAATITNILATKASNTYVNSLFGNIDVNRYSNKIVTANTTLDNNTEYFTGVDLTINADAVLTVPDDSILEVKHYAYGKSL